MFEHIRRLSPQEAGRVAVLMGGNTSEREISLMSGKGVLEALQQRGYQAQAFDPAERSLFELSDFDRAFVILHGGSGENGAMQGLLEVMGIPHTGPGVLACALGMDKLRCKYLWRQGGLPVPDFMSVTPEDDLSTVIPRLGLPLFVKPGADGSSVGVSKVKNESQLAEAVQFAAKYGRDIIIESAVTWQADSPFGGEYAVPIIDQTVLPMIKISPTTEFYDYEAKYFRDDTRYECPPQNIPPALTRAIQQDALLAYQQIGGSGWARVDVLINNDGQHYILEINTSPGMTSHSLVPMGARAVGIDYEDLVVLILSLTGSKV